MSETVQVDLLLGTGYESATVQRGQVTVFKDPSGAPYVFVVNARGESSGWIKQETYDLMVKTAQQSPEYAVSSGLVNPEVQAQEQKNFENWKRDYARVAPYSREQAEAQLQYGMSQGWITPEQKITAVAEWKPLFMEDMASPIIKSTVVEEGYVKPPWGGLIKKDYFATMLPAYTQVGQTTLATRTLIDVPDADLSPLFDYASARSLEAMRVSRAGEWLESMQVGGKVNTAGELVNPSAAELKQAKALGFTVGASKETSINQNMLTGTPDINSAEEYGMMYTAGYKSTVARISLGMGTLTLGPAMGASLVSVAKNIAINFGISEAITFAKEGRFLEPPEVAENVALMGAFNIAGTGVFRGVAEVIPKLVTNPFGRVALTTAFVGSAGFVFSGGNIEKTKEALVLGAAFSIGSELIAGPLIGKIRPHLPDWMLGHTKTLTPGKMTTGKSGEQVETYVSKPIEEFGGRPLRVIADVTENPDGFSGVTKETMINEYIGKDIPTGHATLTPEAFNLRGGGVTLLKGFESESAGFRRAEQLYHFYSAPGSEQYVNVYGGYMGVGEGYSMEAPRIVWSGKSAALVTTSTHVSPEFAPLMNEPMSDFLGRVSILSGKTGIAPETMLGLSSERQLVTPASYERFGEQLPGSVFVSKGKVGTFQIEFAPKGVAGKVPILKTMMTTYKYIDVFSGEYASAVPTSMGAPKSLDVPSYNSSYEKTIKVSMPTFVGPSISSTSIKLSSVKQSGIKETVSVPLSISKMSVSKSILSVGESVRKQASSYPSIKASAPNYPLSTKLSSATYVPAGISESFVIPTTRTTPNIGISYHPQTSKLPTNVSIPSYPSRPSSPQYSFVFPTENVRTQFKIKEKFFVPRLGLYGRFHRLYPIELPGKVLKRFL